MAHQGQIVRELIRALCVLALLFLNFGHAQAASIGYTADLTPYVMSDQAVAEYCLQTGQDNPHDHHQPCHACRIGGSADLPVPPATGLPAFVAVAIVAYEQSREPLPAPRQLRIHGARAPPQA